MKQAVKIYVKKDDLSFDGKTLLIPSYWAGTILDMLNNKVEPEDLQDAQLLKDFISDVIDFKANTESLN